ncbi:MAG TPA: MarR family transcriptional regulator [Acidimicrobiales bacterium]|jgi:DNA-binding MarR family transcriptional regulator
MKTKQFGAGSTGRERGGPLAGGQLAVGLDAEAFGALAGRTLARLAKQVEWALGPFELTLPQYRLLALLADGAAMSSALAERLAVKPPTVTSVVDGLVARGLVERHPDPNDRRRLPLALSEEGAALVRRANAAVGQRLFDLLGAGDEPGDPSQAEESLVTWQRGLDAHLARLGAEKPNAEKLDGQKVTA